MTQTERVKTYLQSGKSLDPLTAWQELGVYRLSSAIHLLRRDGLNILNQGKKVTNRFGEEITVANYVLANDNEVESNDSGK